MARPSKRSALAALERPRLLELAQGFELAATVSSKAKLVDQLARSEQAAFSTILGQLSRDELKDICRAHGLDDSGRAKQSIIDRILGRDAEPTLPVLFEESDLEPEPPTPPPTHTHPPAEFEPTMLPVVRSVPTVEPSAIPKPGELVSVRQRQYLVESVQPAPGPKQMTRLQLVCLDDDNQGRPLDVLWELELGARRLDPAAQGLGAVETLDPPRHFAAYFHAIKWSCVTATDARLFQAPFRAGIRLFQHQLAPLRKALELPRVNLFIADDVGLGKTIEAGLVMQELILRQRLDFILIITPAAITLQWRDEMERRFGLGFEIYNRAFVAWRRKQRGYGVNPWATHNRFIVSYQTLRRPEYREPLLAALREHPHKTLLVLDEAHNVAPASAAKYAIDSQLTKMTRDIAERFEHRLFLSATPHNGHSNSFSALLEILDPQRFTRGVKVTPADLEPIMVRRLKQDLRAIGQGNFPERRLVELRLTHADGQWLQQRLGDSDAIERTSLGEGSDVELELSRLLAEYAAASNPTHKRGKLVFINLQKRLLSSIDAFYRTLCVHARSLGRDVEDQPKPKLAVDTTLDPETYGSDDDGEIDDSSTSPVATASRRRPSCWLYSRGSANTSAPPSTPGPTHAC
jgi:hypothetical protein